MGRVASGGNGAWRTRRFSGAGAGSSRKVETQRHRGRGGIFSYLIHADSDSIVARRFKSFPCAPEPSLPIAATGAPQPGTCTLRPPCPPCLGVSNLPRHSTRVETQRHRGRGGIFCYLIHADSDSIVARRFKSFPCAPEPSLPIAATGAPQPGTCTLRPPCPPCLGVSDLPRHSTRVETQRHRGRGGIFSCLIRADSDSIVARRFKSFPCAPEPSLPIAATGAPQPGTCTLRPPCPPCLGVSDLPRRRTEGRNTEAQRTRRDLVISFRRQPSRTRK